MKCFFVQFWIKLHSEVAKLHSASPREITSPFPREIISKLHSKACNYLYKFPRYRALTTTYSVTATVYPSD